jgi:outer membrane protein TolC
MKKSKIALILVYFLNLSIVVAQSTSKTLSKDEFIGIVKKYHPVLLQAKIDTEIANANVLKSRGAFDPTIQSNFEEKSFDNENYYSYINSTLNIPTWYGIDLKLGVEEVLGDRAENQATLGQTSFAGVKIGVNELIFDKRRAALRQAQALNKLSLADQQLAINDLLFDAIDSYWKWALDYQLLEIVNEAIRINLDRLRFVKLEFDLGSRPAIDTTEISAQLYSFYQIKQERLLNFTNSGLMLSTYLWTENNIPFDWKNDIYPDSSLLVSENSILNLPEINNFLQNIASTHPKLIGMSFKIDVLEIEKKLKAQLIIPKLSLNGNILNKGYNAPNEINQAFVEENYKIGFNFSLPLFLRESRGAYRAANLKLQSTQIENKYIITIIENKIKSYFNESYSLAEQVKTTELVLEFYIKVYQGERIKFENGESTLFLLNTRENKVYETNAKIYELKAKLNKSIAGIYWSSGQLK